MECETLLVSVVSFVEQLATAFCAIFPQNFFLSL